MHAAVIAWKESAAFPSAQSFMMHQVLFGRQPCTLYPVSSGVSEKSAGSLLGNDVTQQSRSALQAGFGASTRHSTKVFQDIAMFFC